MPNFHLVTWTPNKRSRASLSLEVKEAIEIIKGLAEHLKEGNTEFDNVQVLAKSSKYYKQYFY